MKSDIALRGSEVDERLQYLETQLPQAPLDQQTALINVLKTRIGLFELRVVTNEITQRLAEAELQCRSYKQDLEDERNGRAAAERDKDISQLRYELLKQDLDVRTRDLHRSDNEAECPWADQLAEELELYERKLRDETFRADALQARLIEHEMAANNVVDEGGRKRRRESEEAPGRPEPNIEESTYSTYQLE